jgi:hypothetical protein
MIREGARCIGDADVLHLRFLSHGNSALHMGSTRARFEVAAMHTKCQAALDRSRATEESDQVPSVVRIAGPQDRRLGQFERRAADRRA